MGNPTIHSKSPRWRPFYERTLAVFVLIGYLFVLYGSSVGHGWRLLIHLTADHKATSSAPLERKILRTLNPDRLPTPHSHGGNSHQHETSGHHSENHTHKAVPLASDITPNTWNTPHKHDGQLHTHEQKPAPDTALLIVLLLDQHCLFTLPAISLPPSACDMDFGYAPAIFRHRSPPVETPPPRFAA